MDMTNKEVSSLEKRLRGVVAQMRKHPEAVNGRIAADLIERELNNSNTVDIGDYEPDDVMNLMILHKETGWRISWG